MRQGWLREELPAPQCFPNPSPNPTIQFSSVLRTSTEIWNIADGMEPCNRWPNQYPYMPHRAPSTVYNSLFWSCSACPFQAQDISTSIPSLSNRSNHIIIISGLHPLSLFNSLLLSPSSLLSNLQFIFYFNKQSRKGQIFMLWHS